MKRKGSGASTSQLIGIREITEDGLVTERGEDVTAFLIRPSNLSVLSRESLEARIYALMTVLKGVPEMGILCLDSRENFDDVKRFLRARLEEEREPAVRKLLAADLRHLDKMQVPRRRYLLQAKDTFDCKHQGYSQSLVQDGQDIYSFIRKYQTSMYLEKIGMQENMFE